MDEKDLLIQTQRRKIDRMKEEIDAKDKSIKRYQDFVDSVISSLTDLSVLRVQDAWERGNEKSDL